MAESVAMLPFRDSDMAGMGQAAKAAMGRKPANAAREQRANAFSQGCASSRVAVVTPGIIWYEYQKVKASLSCINRQ